MPVRHLSLCAVVLIGCRAATPLPVAAADTLRPKVLIIGVDGLRPDQLQLAHTPRIDFLIANGSVSYTATNTWTPDAKYNGHSAPNWASLLTGVTPAVHAISQNGDGDHLIDDDDANPAPGSVIHTIFGHAKRHDASIRTAVFNTWPGIGMADDTILEHARGVVDHHHDTADGPADVDVRDAETRDAAADLIRSRNSFAGDDADLIFVHFSQVDTAGHASTYDAPEYRAAVERVDAHIGVLLDAIQSRPTYAAESWLILLTADHGGPDDAFNHADNGDPQVRTVPFIVSGRDALKGADLGDASIYHVAPTALAHLGVPLTELGLRAPPVGLAQPTPAPAPAAASGAALLFALLAVRRGRRRSHRVSQIDHARFARPD